MINLWKVVLPRSRAFSIVIEKTMRKFYEGLTWPQYYRDLFDSTYNQLGPQKTDNIDRWEEQFYLPASGLTEQDRRDRLDAVWKMNGGQSPAYLQSIIRGFGFDVYVHDWWQPESGTAEMRCGSETAYSGGENAYLGGSISVFPTPWDPNILLVPPYYPLVNKISSAQYSQFTLGGPTAFCGSDDAFSGKFVGVPVVPDYPIPSDPGKFRIFFYIAGETMPNAATVPDSRRNEFEELILAIFPAHLWGGILVEYT